MGCRERSCRPHTIRVRSVIKKKCNMLNIKSNYPQVCKSQSLEALQFAIDKAEKSYSKLLIMDYFLDRKLVSFQSNKNRKIYRLFKYKEAFSAALVEHYLVKLNISHGTVLDPFSGTGTTSLVSSLAGLKSIGIELLPIGDLVAKVRFLMAEGLSDETIARLSHWLKAEPWEQDLPTQLNALRITKGAYPLLTEKSISNFIIMMQSEETNTKSVLTFALCSILESVSYTRKDGQFLRWDYRSGRGQDNKFNKGQIKSFSEAIKSKISDILNDISFQNNDIFKPNRPNVVDEYELKLGSSLTEMQKIPDSSIKAIITSPPYCNRYDYTRTYALELAVLGITDKDLIDLRQAMISCTVENRKKELERLNPVWSTVVEFCDNHDILSKLKIYLNDQRLLGRLNNNSIPRMIDGYFKEMACVLFESARALESGGYMVMVNDNVRYSGVSIPIDIILTDIAIHCGLAPVEISVLPIGKGNSSQQMGEHGRSSLRKCVYIWMKP